MKILFYASLLLSFLIYSCSPGTDILEYEQLKVNEGIFINQVGFCPQHVKHAVVPSDMPAFSIRNASTGKQVLSGESSVPAYWEFSGDTVSVIDFSKLTDPGVYFITDKDETYRSHTFEIGENIFEDVAKASLKAFYYNRTYMPIEETYGGEWSRPGGHPDTVVYIHESAASETRKEGDVISSPYGWYDAGDYNKYIVNSGISTWALLSFYEAFPEYATSIEINIPESGNNIPDLLDEALFNLKWVITMQDEDGGVYHKLTNKEFGDFEMPHEATTPRYVVQKTTAATLDFAAMMAQSARIYREYLPDFANSCLEASRKAIEWAKLNPGVIYNQPADIHTGAYGDDKVLDEFVWAGLEMYITTHDPKYLEDIDIHDLVVDMPQWADVNSLGIISLALHEESLSDQSKIAQQLVIRFADELQEKYENSPFRVSLDFFRWGSNSDVALQGIFKLLAYRFTEDQKYLNSAVGDLDYILGKNPTGYSYVTGFGHKSPLFIHHRPSGADGIDEPVPGFLAGGPNLAALLDCGPNVERSQYPAKSFVDLECSYSTNEIAINWNAPLFYLAAGVNHFCNE